MPTVLYVNGFRFYFYSGEGNEPPHIHIKKGSGRGKMWLSPTIENEYFYGFTTTEIREIKRIAFENQTLLIQKWNEYFGK